ncbi:MAG: class I SAM-dependent methyltransferase [Chthoniobacterales bacterium]|nr:class I SAM-dependent methyltransferase [Chthoniobacterales bacterium]
MIAVAQARTREKTAATNFDMTFNPNYDHFYRARPAWLRGSISYRDGLFLQDAIRLERPSFVLEIGTASGFSAASLCHSLEIAARSHGGRWDYRVISYDIAPYFYADKSKSVGDAAKYLLDASLLAHIEFRNPRRAADAIDEFPPDSVPFVFIDANHKHPWPALDLLALTNVICPGGSVILHDINLPILQPTYQFWGPHHLFADLNLEKTIPTGPGKPANIGQLRMPEDKTSLRHDLLTIINAHPWEIAIDDHYLSRLGLRRVNGAAKRVPVLDRLRSFFRSAPTPAASHVEFMTADN